MTLACHFTDMMPRGARVTSITSAGPNQPAASLLEGCRPVEVHLFANLEIQLLGCHGGTRVERPAQTGSR
eukprot:4306764-Lingulodinium_polyedra.AAC.1